MKKKKIIYLINDLPFFLSHRIAIANEAFKSGYLIHLITGNPASKKMEKTIINSKILNKFYRKELNFESSNLNIFKNLFYLRDIYFEFKKINPAIVHLVSLKPIISPVTLELSLHSISQTVPIGEGKASHSITLPSNLEVLLL